MLVVADDLTGANATAAGLARAGLRAVTLGSDQRVEAVAEFAARFDAVVVSTDSRHSPPTEAARLVTRAVRAGWPVALVSCRIDTTLRGNVSASAAAARRAVEEQAGRRAVALCVPAHPAAGRHTVDGTQLLDGRRLEETELARDPRSPVTTSRVVDVLTAAEPLVTAAVPLAAVTGSAEELQAALRDAVDAGAEAVVVDALTEEHLDRVAAAAVALSGALADPPVWVAVDPGPMTVALARALGLAEGAAGVRAPLLVVSGSATALTRDQLARLVGETDAVVVRPARTDDGTPLPDVDGTADVLGRALAAASPDQVVVLATALTEADVVPVSPEVGEALPARLARATRRALEEQTVDGVFSTGGDVTAALLAELGARGLEVDDEVVPLAVAGTVVGGPWAGLPVVTKGGLVGDAGTTVACVAHLRRAADAGRRHVRSAQPRSPL